MDINAELTTETSDVDTIETPSSSTPLVIAAVTTAVVAGGFLLGRKLGWFGAKKATDEIVVDSDETPDN